VDSNPEALSLASSVVTERRVHRRADGPRALMLRDMRAAGRRPWLLPAIGAAAGVGYWIRYAGLFLVPVAAIYIVWRWWRDRAMLPWAAAGLLAAGLLIVPIQIRNIVYTGSWRGWTVKAGGYKFGAFLGARPKSSYHLVFGSGVPARPDIWIGCSRCRCCCCASCDPALRSASGRAVWKFPPGAPAWMGLLAVAYLAGVALAALTSIYSDLARYFMPVLPVTAGLLCRRGFASCGRQTIRGRRHNGAGRRRDSEPRLGNRPTPRVT